MVFVSFMLVSGIIALVPGVFAFSWAGRRPTKYGPHEVDKFEGQKATFENFEGLALSSDEVDTLFFGSNGISSYENKPDCFKTAVGYLRIRCGEQDMDEDDRVTTAISMTLCELATARHHSPPLECAAFSTQTFITKAQTSTRGVCVEALSRSAQFWSSYSGYLRDVPQLCFAFGRWNDIDTAKSIYHNATLEKVALLRHMAQREKRSEDNLQSFVYTVEIMRSIVDEIHTSSSAMKNTGHNVIQRIQRGFDDLLRDIADSLIYARTDMDNRNAQILSQIAVHVNDISSTHAASLARLVPSMEISLTSHLEKLFAVMAEQNAGVFDMTALVREKWDLLDNEFSRMQHSIDQLTLAATHAAAHLDVHSQQAVFAQRVQQESSNTALQINDALTQLVAVTQVEMKHINDTAAAVQERLLSYGIREESWLWWKEICIRWMTVLVQLDPGWMQHIIQLPVFSIAARILEFSFLLLQFSSSSFMSLFLLILSSRRWLLRRSAAQSARPSIFNEPINSHLSVPHSPSPYHPHEDWPHLPRLVHPRIPFRSPSKHRFSRIPDRLLQS